MKKALVDFVRRLVGTKQLSEQLVQLHEAYERKMQECMLTRQEEPAQARREPSSIFVLGHARSGTTVLLRALNASPDVWLLGEANLCMHANINNFSSWYNEMHVQFNNGLEKTTCLPVLPCADADGWDVLDFLGSRYKYVGEKVAFNNHLNHQRQYFNFQLSNFIGGHYLCVIRRPMSTIVSSIRKFDNNDFSQTKISEVVFSICRTYDLIISVYKTFKHVFVLQHEMISGETFDFLAKELGGVDLRHGYGYYDNARRGGSNECVEAIERNADYQRLLTLHNELLSCVGSTYNFENLAILHTLHEEKIFCKM